MWQGTNSICIVKYAEPELLQPTNPIILVWFALICSPRAGSRAARYWHLIPLAVDEYGTNDMQVVWPGPRVGFVAEKGMFVNQRFSCFFCLLSSSFTIMFFRRHSGMSLFVLPRPCSRRVPLQQVHVLCVICVLPHLISSFVYLYYVFRSCYFLGGGCYWW